MATLKYLSQYFITSLNVGGGIDASQTTGIVLQSVAGVSDISKPGQICVSYSDPIDTGVAEWINYTSINGSNELVGVTRGCEGYSAHTHLQGATVAFVMSASHHNDVVNAVKKVYNETSDTLLKASSAEITTGTEDAKIVTPKGLKDAGIVAHTKAAGSDITTGTDDAKYATSKALANADLNTRLKSKVITSTRDLTAATADISYTGVGFEPTSIIAICNIDGSTNSVSFGFADSGKSSSEIEKDSNTYWYKNDILLRASTSVGSSFQNATIKSYDSDGFTISWIKAGSPTGTANLIFLCFR